MSVVQALASGVDVAPSEDGKYPVKKPAAPAPPPKSIQIPDSHTEICRTALGFAGGRKWLQGGNCILFSNNMTIDTLHKNPH